MRLLTVLLLVALFCSCQNDPLPNILFVLADDQRNNTLGCAGHPIIETPVLDDLASHGVRFTNAFVTTPICAASRASFLTGLTERSHGYTFGKDPVSRRHMRSSYPTLMREAGYRLGFFGKFGVKMDFEPDSLFDDHHFRDRPYLTPEGHIDMLNTAQAIDFIEADDGSQPFCLSVSYSSAHAEDGDHEPGELHHFAVIDPLKGKYKNAVIEDPRLGDTAIFHAQPSFLKESLNRVRYHWRWDTPEKYRENIKAYYGLISGIDHMVGELRDALERKGLSENTVIIYMADNGYYMADRGFAGKWSHYEESLRVPLIVYDPRSDGANQGKLYDQTALNLDVPATILDLAGLPVPDAYQGRSLTGFLGGQATPDWRSDFFCEHLMDHEQIPKWEGVRSDQYIYANYFEQDPPYEFLHDFKKDPDQLINLVDDPAYAEILGQYRARTREYVEAFSPH